MPVCDKWVALKIIEFDPRFDPAANLTYTRLPYKKTEALVAGRLLANKIAGYGVLQGEAFVLHVVTNHCKLLCVSCLVAKRVSQDDEARLALLLQKLSREWSLLTSVTWDSVGGAFADAVYGGYVIITFGLILARVFQEVPRGRRILEGFFLGFGMLFFLVLGGLELASLDSVPRNLAVNASVLGTLSLAVAALFLIDLMGPRIYTATHQSQTDGLNSPKLDKKVSIVTQTGNGNNNQKDEITEKKNGLINGDKQSGQIKKNGQLPLERPKKLDIEKVNEKTQKGSDVVDSPFHGYTNFDEVLEPDLEASKFGSLRNGMEGGNYVRLSDPFAEPDFKMHYEQELAKFNEKYLRNYLEMIEPGRLPVKENYLPELQTPVFAKVKSGRLKSIYDDVSPSYGEKMSPTFETRRSRSPTRVRTVPTPTLQQLEDYLRSPSRGRRSETPLFPIEEKETPDVDGRASGTPTDPGFVQYTAKKWPDKREIRTPRHSPT